MLRLHRYPVLLTAIASYLYLAGSAPFLGQWDSYDYLKQIVTNRFSDLGFGRPVYLGCSILLWESMKRIFHLEPLQVEVVAMTATIVCGAAGVLIFERLSREYLSPAAGRMAALALAISPMYAVYSGYIMTEVPMLVVLMASALVLVKQNGRRPALSDIFGGILFGAAIGIREQALTMAPALLWVILSRNRNQGTRLRSFVLFGSAAGMAVLLPMAALFLAQPAIFTARIATWLRALPTGSLQFWNNVQASFLFTIAVCPASWLAAAAAGAFYLFGRRQGRNPETPICNPVLGILCWIVFPIAALWRDADVQIHPRYLLLALPGSLILCASMYSRLVRSAKAPAVWAILHVLVFGGALVAIYPFRQVQNQKMEFAGVVRDRIPGEGLIIAGGYSPILDYYRGIGLRPQWRILWSGWTWNAREADDMVREAWLEGIPIYLIENHLAWRYFESEYLHYYLRYLRGRTSVIKIVPIR